MLGKRTTIAAGEYGGSRDNVRVERVDDTAILTLLYPPRNDSDNDARRARFINIDQESVRASDGLRVMYDYQRDGWSIQQPQVLSWAVGDPRMGDMQWIETAFVESWAVHHPDDPGISATIAPRRPKPLHAYAIAATLTKPSPNDPGVIMVHTALVTGWFQRERQAKAYMRRCHRSFMLKDWDMVALHCTRVQNARQFQPQEMTR